MRRALEITNKKKQAIQEKEAKIALERALKQKLAEAKKNAVDKEEAAKKEAARKEATDRHAQEIMLADARDLYDSSESDSANLQEPGNGNAQSNEPKQPISDVMWDANLSSHYLRGFKYMNGRTIEVLKPRLSNRKPAGAVHVDIPKSTGAIPKKRN